MGQIFSHLRGITHNAPLAPSVGLQALDLLLLAPRSIERPRLSGIAVGNILLRNFESDLFV